jgi:hypothetical protein
MTPFPRSSAWPHSYWADTIDGITEASTTRILVIPSAQVGTYYGERIDSPAAGADRLIHG